MFYNYCCIGVVHLTRQKSIETSRKERNFLTLGYQYEVDAQDSQS